MEAWVLYRGVGPGSLLDQEYYSKEESVPMSNHPATEVIPQNLDEYNSFRIWKVTLEEGDRAWGCAEDVFGGMRCANEIDFLEDVDMGGALTIECCWPSEDITLVAHSRDELFVPDHWVIEETENGWQCQASSAAWAAWIDCEAHLCSTVDW